jgi:prepilin-type N-terminal cleavage/methylation domain-containing protein
MRKNKRHAGFSLIEMIVVIGIVALVTAMVMPILPQMLKSNRQGAARDLIRGYLTLARAHAAQTQKYAGIRFQPSAKGVQYMVLIEYGDDVSNGARFVAAAKTKPIALPDGIGVISTEVMSPPNPFTPDGYLSQYPYDIDHSPPPYPDSMYCLNGARTFSIIFSPTGQLVTRMVEVYPQSGHKTFGTYNQTTLNPYNGNYRLLSHDYEPYPSTSAPWCSTEDSVGGLVIYEIDEMESANANRRYSDYVYADDLPVLLINMYTGALIE